MSSNVAVLDPVLTHLSAPQKFSGHTHADSAGNQRRVPTVRNRNRKNRIARRHHKRSTGTRVALDSSFAVPPTFTNAPNPIWIGVPIKSRTRNI